MKQYFILAGQSIRNHGLKLVVFRFFRFMVVKLKRLLVLYNKGNINKWHTLKDKYNGKRVFIIANGPSLNQTELFLLKNEYTICFNHFNLMLPRIGFIPTFFMITDDLVIRDLSSNFISDVLPKFEESFFPDVHPSNTDFRKYIQPASNVNWIHTDFPGFHDDLPRCGINRTVVNASLQVLAYLGFSEIYLLGVDASYSFEIHKVKNETTRDLVSEENDPNHFDPRYFGKGKKYHFQPMDEMVLKLQAAKEFFDERQIKIINAGFGGQLEVFPRKPLLDVLDLDEKVIEKLFNDVLLSYGVKVDFSKDKTKPIKDESLFDYDSELVLVENDLGLKLIPKLIHSHLAIGPIYDMYGFIKLKDKFQDDN